MSVSRFLRVFRVLLTVAATVLAAAVAVTVASSHAAHASADASTGSAGYFTPIQARELDTRNGTGGYSTPMPAGGWRTVHAEAYGGIPDTASALSVSITVINAAGPGFAFVAQAGTPTGTPTSSSIDWNKSDTVSNTAMVAVNSTGEIQVYTASSVDMLIDVQGYFTPPAPSGDPQPQQGGFTAVTGTRILTQTGVASGSSVNVTARGVAGVPASASSVFVNIAVTNHATSSGYISAYPTGSTPPSTSLNFAGKTSAATVGTTAFGTNVQLNASGQFTITVGTAASPVDLYVDVQGYYDGSPTTGAFTPASARLYDSRVAPNTAIPTNSVVAIPVANLDGVPDASSAVAAESLEITALSSSSSPGYLRAWGTNNAEPTTVSSVNIAPTQARSNLVTVPPGLDNQIYVRNASNAPINVIIDVEGWYATPNNLPYATAGDCTASGNRSGARAYTHPLTDTSTLTWSPVTGDLLVTQTLLKLRSVGQQLSIGLRYNSLSNNRPTLNVGYLESALLVKPNGDVTYTASDGGCYTFTSNGDGTWNKPAGLNATLSTGTSQSGQAEYKLRFNPGGVTNYYLNDGSQWHLADSQDAGTTSDHNQINYNYSGGLLRSIRTSENRSVTFAYNDANDPIAPSQITDTSLGSPARSIYLTYGAANGALSSLIDAAGDTSTFGYTNGKLTGVTDGNNHTTAIGYDYSTGRPTSWTYASGTPNAGTWTPAYVSSTKTTLQDPNGHTGTYTLSSNTVTKITDPLGHDTSTSWSAHNDLASLTDALGNATTLHQNANDITDKITSPNENGAVGANIAASYPNDGADTIGDYRASSSSDPQGNTTKYNYDQTSQNVKTVTTAGGQGGNPTRTYQGDDSGTDCGAKYHELCSSTDGNGNKTSYDYDSQGNLTSIERPAPLGAIDMSYDGAGRITSETDGAGNTVTYKYDGDDRITEADYSATGQPTVGVVYTFDPAGNLIKRSDPTGTTTYGYDEQNRPTSQNGPAGAASSASYDPAGNMTSYIGGPASPVTYCYDAANRLTGIALGNASCSGPTVQYSYDNANRRTKISYPGGITTTINPDGAGRDSSITTKNSAGTTLVSRSYNYTSGQSGGDGSLVHSVTDENGTTTTYGYDQINRLTSAATGSSTQSWTYDDDGNRTSAAQTGKPTSYAAFNTADQLCWTGSSSGSCGSPPSGATSYHYDGAGNLVSDSNGNSYAYTTADQMNSSTISGTSASYAYADTDSTHRVSAGTAQFDDGILGIDSRTDTNGTVGFVRDPQGNLVALQRPDRGLDYYTTDELGSTLLLTNDAGTVTARYTYDAWGNTTSSTGTDAALNPYRYAAGYTDPTGLIKFGTRYYDPTLGRFTQTDPAHQDANPYTYAASNPINNIDPTGKDLAQAVEGLAGGFSIEIGGEITGSAAGVAASVGLGAGLLVGGIGVAIIGIGVGISCLSEIF